MIPKISKRNSMPTVDNFLIPPKKMKLLKLPITREAVEKRRFSSAWRPHDCYELTRRKDSTYVFQYILCSCNSKLKSYLTFVLKCLGKSFYLELRVLLHFSPWNSIVSSKLWINRTCSSRKEKWRLRNNVQFTIRVF